jgi:hypothetical protein
MSLKTSFVLAEMFSLSLGEIYAPTLKDLPPTEPLVISEILDKFSGFLDHNNALRNSKKFDLLDDQEF